MKKLLFVLIGFALLSCSKDETIKEIEIEVPETKEEVEVKYTIITNDDPYTIEYSKEDGIIDPYIYGVHGTDLNWEYSFIDKEGGLIYLYYYSKNQSIDDVDKLLKMELTVYLNNKIYYQQEYINYHNVSGSIAAIIPTIEEINALDDY